MKTVYQSWNAGYYELQSEVHTIDYLDTVNDTNYLRLFKKGEITGEEVARKNHDSGSMYCVTILDDDGVPYCALDIVRENEFIGIDFLDNNGRINLTYHFCEVNPMKRLFLEEVWYTFTLIMKSKTEIIAFILYLIRMVMLLIENTMIWSTKRMTMKQKSLLMLMGCMRIILNLVTMKDLHG